jgi:hypothetical protein
MPIIDAKSFEELTRLRRQEKAFLRWREAFLSHLNSDKFKGTETHCPTHAPHKFSGCAACNIPERKDWMAVQDIQNWLRCLEDQRNAE